MIGFFTDLDNTLIYSYKHDIGTDKECVEFYNDREISFATKNTLKLIKELNNSIMIIPTSTRTIEQFNRIRLGINFKYSLVCNGGILLVDGVRDKNWYQDSLSLVEESIPEVKKAINYLKDDSRRYFEQRFIENLFLFTKCHEPENVVNNLKKLLNISIVDVFNNGDKVYVVPNTLSKGRAIKRFLEKVKLEKTFSAGDSEFDISMVKATDIGIIPKEFPISVEKYNSIYQANKNMVFSDELLDYITKGNLLS